MPEGLSAESAGCEALRDSLPADGIRSALSRERSDLDNVAGHLLAMERSGMDVKCTWLFAVYAFCPLMKPIMSIIFAFVYRRLVSVPLKSKV